jgi:threonine/homoserine/homoserine lactone efflux protein
VLAYVLQGITIGFSAGVTPGPLMAYFLSQALQNGWKRTLPAALAPLVSDGPIIFLVLVLLTQTPIWLLDLLRIAGGMFILFLSWQSLSVWRSAPTINSLTQARPTSLRDAALMNLLNPAPYIFWATILGPILLEGWRRTASLGFGFVAAFYGTMIACFMALIVLFASARQLGPRVVRVLGLVAAVAMAIFGVYQLTIGVSGALAG